MSKGNFRWVSLGISAAFAVLFCLHGVYGQIVSAQEFSGRATGVNATVTINGVVTNSVTGDTCPLPPRGGTSTVTTSGVMIPGMVGTGTIVSTTSGAGITSQSSSSVSDFFFAGAGWTIKATNITTRTQCNCCDIANPGCSGETVVSGLSITDPNGAAFNVNITGSANQVVTLPGGAGTITFNELDAAPGSLTVNGMHLNITSGTTNYNLVIASAHSNIVCPSLVRTPADVNVSGHVLDQNGAGIGRTTVSIMGSQGQVIRSAITGFDGKYTLTGITVGQTYVVTATSKTYTFAPKTITLLDEMTGVDLIGTPR